jgi:hypothetical protein
VEPAGSPCLDDTVCNGDESCDGAGTCVAGTPLECSDGELCTRDTCDPVLGCHSDDAPSCAAEASTDGRITIVVNGAGETQLKWTKRNDILYPSSAPDDKPSALCIWDTHGGGYDRVFKASLPAEPSSWTFKSGLLYYSFAAFHDDLGLHDGFTKIISVRRGFPGRTKFSLLLAGPNTPAAPVFSPERMFDQSSTVYVEFNDEVGHCTGSYFQEEDTSKNLAKKFRAGRR